jgi:prepilin-type processing-associated H-X9-DG protein
LYRPAGSNVDTRNQRQKFDNLPDPPNNLLVGCSNTTTIEADQTGQFKNQETGDPKRFNGMAPYLFLDGSVRILSPDDVQYALSLRTPGRTGHAIAPGN